MSIIGDEGKATQESLDVLETTTFTYCRKINLEVSTQ